MKIQSFARLVAVLSFALVPLSIPAQVLFWDPDGSTIGTSVPGSWNTVTANWTTSPDSGANTVWSQGSAASFGVDADYTVTLSEPITAGNFTVSGTAGALTVAGSSLNSLTLGSSSIFDITASRTVNLSAPIGGGFDLTKSGGGTLTLSGVNTFSGGTIISSGSGFIGIAVDTVSSGGVITSSALGTGPITVNTAGHRLFASGGARVLENPVTLNAGLTIVGSENLTFRGGNWLVNAGTRVITVSNTALTTIEGNLTDDGTARTLQKAGPGTLVLAGTNSSYLGQLVVNANSGTLRIGSDSALQVGSVVTVNAGGTLDLNGFKGSVNGLAGDGSVTLGSGTLTITNSTTTSRNHTGVISGSGGVIVSSSGVSQQISGVNTFNGGLLLRMGTTFLRTNSAATDNITRAAGTGTITIEDTGATPRPAIGANYSSGTVRFTNSIFLMSGRGLFFPSNGGANQFDGTVSGPGGFLRDNNGSGLVIITGDNTYSGGLQIESRAIALGHKKALGTGTFIIGNPSTLPANMITIVPTVNLSGADAITNVTTVNQSFALFATNNFELSGPMTLAGAATVIALGDGAIKFSGNIDGPVGFTKAGTNSLILTGANTYAGDTSVVEGTLLVNNTSGSGTGAGNVSVNTAGTLGGNGTVSGAVSVGFGASIGGGSSAGKLTLLNGLDLSTGGANIWELAAEKDSNTGTAGTDFDQLSLTGGNLVLGGSSTLVIRFTGSATSPTFGNPFWRTSHTWKIISLSGTAANPGNSDFGAIAGTNNIAAGTFSTSVDGSGNVVLSYVAAPLPPRPVIDGSIIGAGTTSATITWSSAVSGVTYVVQYKNDLNDANWSVLGSVVATGATASITDPTDPPAANRFYRIVVQ